MDWETKAYVLSGDFWKDFCNKNICVVVKSYEEGLDFVDRFIENVNPSEERFCYYFDNNLNGYKEVLISCYTNVEKHWIMYYTEDEGILVYSRIVFWKDYRDYFGKDKEDKIDNEQQEHLKPPALTYEEMCQKEHPIYREKIGFYKDIIDCIQDRVDILVKDKYSWDTQCYPEFKVSVLWANEDNQQIILTYTHLSRSVSRVLFPVKDNYYGYDFLEEVVENLFNQTM